MLLDSSQNSYSAETIRTYEAGEEDICVVKNPTRGLRKEGIILIYNLFILIITISDTTIMLVKND